MMNSRSTIRFTLFSLIVSGAVFLSGVTASADVTVERFTKFGGYYGQGAFEANEKVSYRGLNQRTDRTRKFTGSFLSKVTGLSEASTITRIKKDVIWEVDHKGKSYTEGKITPERAEQSEEGGSSSKGNSGSKGKGEQDKKTHRVIKNEVKVKDTGEKRKINGFACKRYILTWELVTEEIETKARSTSLMTNDMWNTNNSKATKALQASENDYMRAYLKKLKLDVSPADMKQMGLKYIAVASPGDAKKLRKQIKKIKGFNIVTTIKWEQSTSEPEESKSTKKKEGGGGFGGFGSISDALGSAAKKAMTKKKKPGEKELIFKSYTEIIKISTDGKGKGHFSIPKGYEKKKGSSFKLPF